LTIGVSVIGLCLAEFKDTDMITWRDPALLFGLGLTVIGLAGCVCSSLGTGSIVWFGIGLTAARLVSFRN
jgi:hypothetical protein